MYWQPILSKLARYCRITMQSTRREGCAALRRAKFCVALARVIANVRHLEDLEMTKSEIRELLKKLIDEANIVAPSIDNFEKDGSYGSVTDENLYWESLVSWETETQAILAQLSKLNTEVFSSLNHQYSEIKEQSKEFHSKSILV